MRLINVNTLEQREFADPPRYAILSHRWTDEELAFKDYQKLHDLKTAGVDKVKQFCAFVRGIKVPTYPIKPHGTPQDEKALEWAWIDTCCIDKSSSSELSEAINSMWTWYRSAVYCVAYLSDVHMYPVRCDTEDPTKASSAATAESLGDVDGRCNTRYSVRTEMLKAEIENSEWFTRGWTLQELLAPDEVIFCNQYWHTIGRKTDSSFCRILTMASGIPMRHLMNPWTLPQASVARRLSWASGRVTTRVEDLAYSLLGLCDVNMPLLYGEGKKAFLRLQEEIIKQSDDESIFAWTRESKFTTDWRGRIEVNPVLAEHPRDFKHSRDVCRISKIIRQPYSITNKGLLFVADAAYNQRMNIYLVPLNCAEGSSAIDTEVGFDSTEATPCLVALKENEYRKGSYSRVGRNSLYLRNWGGSLTMTGSDRPNDLRQVKEKQFLIETRW